MDLVVLDWQVPSDDTKTPAVEYDGVHPDAKWYLAGGGGGGLFNPSPKINPDRGGKGGGGRVAVANLVFLVLRDMLDLLTLAVVAVEQVLESDNTVFTVNGGSGVVLIAYPT